MKGLKGKELRDVYRKKRSGLAANSGWPFNTNNEQFFRWYNWMHALWHDA